MDLSNRRRWIASAVLSLLAAGSLALAAFLPLYVSADTSEFGVDVSFTVTVIGWQSTVYPQVFGAALALAAGVLAFRRKGGRLFLVASGAFNLGVMWMLLTLYPPLRTEVDLGPGFWCLIGGLLVAIAAPTVVPRRVTQD